MRDHIDTIRGLGAELVIVGNGRPEFARGFRDDLELDVPILVDPDLVSYRAAGLRRGRTELLAPRLWSNAFFLDREARRTHLWPFTRESDAERERLWAVCERMAASREGGPGDRVVAAADRLEVVSS